MPLQNFLSKINPFKKSATFSLRSRSNIKFLNGFLDGFLRLNAGSRNNELFITDGYASNPYVYMVTSKIAEVTASLPRIVQGSGNALSLYNEPNEFQSKEEFEVQHNIELLVTGDMFLVITEGIGAGIEWRSVRPSNMEIVVDSIGRPEAYIEQARNKHITHTPENVLHIKFPNIVSDPATGSNDYLYGMSPLQAAWAAVIASNELFNAEKHIFKNKGIAGILTTDSDTPLLPKEKAHIQEKFDEEVGGSQRFNKVVVSNTRLRYLQMGMSPSDMKLIENTVSKLRVIAAVYGLDSKLFNDPGASTYNNMKEAVIAAYTNAYLPLARKVDSAKSRYLAKRFGSPFTIEVDKSQIEVFQREDIQQNESNNEE